VPALLQIKRAFKEKHHRSPESWETMVIGAVSGGFAAAVTNPFDVVTTRLMVQVRTAASCVGVPARLASTRCHRTPPPPPRVEAAERPRAALCLLASRVHTRAPYGAGGALDAGVSLPTHTVQWRLLCWAGAGRGGAVQGEGQRFGKGLLGCFRETWRESPASLWRGTIPRVCHMTPLAAIQFAVYEYTKGLLAEWR
jgi:hypothetical protein